AVGASRYGLARPGDVLTRSGRGMTSGQKRCDAQEREQDQGRTHHFLGHEDHLVEWLESGDPPSPKHRTRLATASNLARRLRTYQHAHDECGPALHVLIVEMNRRWPPWLLVIRGLLEWPPFDLPNAVRGLEVAHAADCPRAVAVGGEPRLDGHLVGRVCARQWVLLSDIFWRVF